MSELIIGLMAGTSADGVDAALVDTSLENNPKLIASHFHPYPAEIQTQIIDTAHSESAEFDAFFGLDNAIAEEFANASSSLIKLSGISCRDVTAIGSHGQTIRHKPDAANNYTVQLGNPAVLLARTGIDVVSDFRRADMAFGGQGAPLAPLFHDHVFRESGKNTVVLNLGGIANISVLKDKEPVIGFDTGPASALMDYWISRNRGIPMDVDGSWAAGGKVNNELLNHLLDDSYFSLPPPKSTGREYFGEKWLHDNIVGKTIAAEDVQSTLCELTARSISDAIKLYCQPCNKVVVCGGGAANKELLNRINAALPGTTISNPSEYGLNANFLEAVVFAWLASQNLNRRPVNLKNVTGGPRQLVVGCLYPASFTP